MRLHEPVNSVVEAEELPHIVRLEENLFAVSFSLMKLLPAKYIMECARSEGLLGPDTVVLESSSGTFGLALAMVCALQGRRLILVSDPAIDSNFMRQLESLGAKVDIIEKPSPQGGYQRARLERLAEYRKSYSDHYWPCQYDNPLNPQSYFPVAEILAEALGRVDCLVGSVGSGGSMCGTARMLLTLFPQMKVVGVDTHGSVLFGLKESSRVLRGLGNSIIPENLDHRLFDEVHWVSAAEAYHMTRRLYREHAMFHGGTSGATYLAARWWARRHPERTVVALFPDTGHRYLHSIYDDHWLAEQELLLEQVPEQPLEAETLYEVGDDRWTRLEWGQRTLDETSGPTRKAVGEY